MTEERKAKEDWRVAAMLNDAKACGMEMNGLSGVLSDYFTAPISASGNAESDEDVSDNDGESMSRINQ